jgi:SAM-dependent methyltransferase
MIDRGVLTGESIEEYGVMKRIERIKHIWKNDQGYILDVGCGYGAYTKLLAGNSILAVGLDIKWEFIKKARKENSGENIEFVLASGDFLPFKAETFDSVFLIETLEHILDDGKF